MSFLSRCISGNSLRGMVRGEDDLETTSGTTTPNDTLHGASFFASKSWRGRLSRQSRSSVQSSPKKSRGSPPPSACSLDGTGAPAMEPVMERTRSALTDLEAVKFLVEDWSHKQWRPATPQDQERFDRLEQSDIKPLVALGEGAYGSVNLCRIPASASSPYMNRGGSASVSGSDPQPGTRQAFSAVSSPLPTGGPPMRGRAGSPPPARRCGTSHDGVGTGVVLGLQPQDSEQLLGLRREDSGAADSSADTAPSERESQSAAASGASPSGAAASGSFLRGSSGHASARHGHHRTASSGSAFAIGEEEEFSGGAAGASSSSGDAGAGPSRAGSGADDPGQGPGQGPFAATSESSALSESDRRSSLTPQPSLGNDPQLIVAVKRVPLGWNQERELMQLHRCQRCPFIVRLFGFVEDGEEHCSYVMEWAEGGDLGGMLGSLKDRRGANKQRLLMGEASARYYTGCLLLALEFLHDNGLLHRDIKPSNLLLTSDGTAKLADLGFTVALDSAGKAVGCCGTTGYIAPEVFAYGSSKTRMGYGIPADIWSAGATLYQMMTGTVVTDHPEEILKKGWRPPTHPRFSNALQDLLNRMLAAKPHNRPQSAQAVMRHPWFAAFDWAALREGRMKAPYVPAERRRTRSRPADLPMPAPSGVLPANLDAASSSPSGAPASASAASASSSGAGAGAGTSAGGSGSGSANPAGAAVGGVMASGSGAGSSSGAAANGPPPASPGGQRLWTVMERAPSGACTGGGAGGAEPGPDPEADVVQRSAISGGHHEGSVRCGREGLLRSGSSFETGLDTLTPDPAYARPAGAGAGAGASAGTGSGSVASGGSGRAAAAAVAEGSTGTTPHAHGHGHGNGHDGNGHAHGHGLSVRFALGVAKCA